MRFLKRINLISVILFLIFFALILELFKTQKPQISQTAQKPQNTQGAQSAAPVVTVKPTDTPFTMYKQPALAKSSRYNIYLIGDSMTNAFGPRGGIFNELLSAAYPGIFFNISNYAEANQSILLLPKRLHETVQAAPDLLLQPIFDGHPDLIILESFGYNPLSQFGIEGGLKKQTEMLTQVMTTLTNRFPNTDIMFFAVIGPNKETYGEKATHSDAQARWAQAEERISYITNHIAYAKAHNIPVINAYAESLDAQGDGQTKYINPDDNIHPSAEGLAFMARIMTKRIQEENIFPKP